MGGRLLRADWTDRAATLVEVKPVSLRTAVKAFIGELKAAPPVRYGGAYSRLPGWGVNYLPPQSQMDYGRLAGDLSMNSVVAVCLGWLADNMPSARLEAGFEIDDKWEADAEHPLTVWFTKGRPNPLYTWRQVWGATVAAWKVDGNAYWWAGRALGGLGRVQEVYWLPNSCVEIETDSQTGEPAKYRYQPWGTAREQEFRPDEILHFRDGIDPQNPVLGISRLKRVIRNVAGLNAGETYTAAILRNFGVVSHVLTPKAPMTGIATGTPEEAEMLAEKRRLERGSTGENAGRPHAVTIPIEYVKLGQGPEEMMLDRILDRPEAVVCAAMGLNALVTGLPASDASRTYSNLGEANKQAWQNALIPMQDTFAEMLQNAFLGDFADGTELRWNRSKVEALNEDAESRVNRAVALFQAGLLPQNRCLDVAGLDPEDGGDERYSGDPTPKQEEMGTMMGGMMPGQEMGTEEPDDDKEEPEPDEAPDDEETADE
jgi:phage portal protein BeeE